MQNEELVKIKARIRALTEKTVSAGCTEMEAQAAMEKVGELLMTYNLSMSEIEMHDEVFIDSTIDLRTASRNAAAAKFVVGLATFCHCKVWFQPGKKSKGTVAKYHFFGMEPDVEMVKYLYTIIDAAMMTEQAKFVSSHYTGRQERGILKVATTNFRLGFARRIDDRLYDLKIERDAYEAAHMTTGTSLVVIKDQLVEAEFVKESKKHKLRSHKITHRVRQHSEAFNAGVIAAQNVNLSRPIETPGKNKLQLK